MFACRRRLRSHNAGVSVAAFRLRSNSCNHLLTRSAALVLIAGVLAHANTLRAQESVVVEALPRVAIDNERVARDLADAARNKGTVAVWSFNERAKGAALALPLPMFIPGEVVADLAAGSEAGKGVLREKSDTEADARIMSFADEVFVVRRFGNVRVTVQGTRKVFTDQGGGSEKKAASAPAPDYYSGFTPTYSGGQINFGYAGAQYLVEFECELGEDSCITEADAERVVGQLALCNTDGRCIDRGTELIRR
jgi:hypothetical protein